MADETRNGLADGKIGSARGAGGDDEELALCPARLCAEAKRDQQHKGEQPPKSQDRPRCETPLHGTALNR